MPNSDSSLSEWLTLGEALRKEPLRSQFLGRVQHLIKTYGSEWVLSDLLRYKQDGDSAAYLQAALIASRSSSNRSLVVNVLESLHNKYPSSFHICLEYARALFSNAKLDEAISVLHKSLQYRRNPNELNAAATLFANMGYYRASQDVSRFTDERNFNASVLRMRQDLSLNSSVHTRSQLIIPILVINLETDKWKYKLSEKLLGRTGQNPSRVNAIRGDILPSAVQRCTDRFSLFRSAPGTIACALSHKKCWEIAAQNPLTLILEDDGLPFYNFAPQLEVEINALNDFDILFVNERMSNLRARTLSSMGAVSVSERLSRFPDSADGWGGDGYLLSKTGANKLLEMFGEDQLCEHIDTQMVAYGVTSDTSPLNEALNKALEARRRFLSKGALNAYALNFPMIQQINFGHSSRHYQNGRFDLLARIPQ